MSEYINKALVILRNSSRMSKDFAIEHNTDLHKGMHAAFETSIGVIEEAIAGRETWRDISTAPRDGTEIIGLVNNEVFPISYTMMNGDDAQGWSYATYTWGGTLYEGNNSVIEGEATHWMPLPKPPE